jgi:NADH-quinone oxidoreductase subunit H
MQSLKFLPIVLCFLISVAFLTVFERKLLASMQRRRGPNVVGYYGSLQAIADAIKLLFKEYSPPTMSIYNFFFLSPIITLIFSLYSWTVIPFAYNAVIADINLAILFLMMTSSLGVYGIIMAGWSSNSKYSFLGALRSSAQLISYEVSFGILLMAIMLCSNSANLIIISFSFDHISYFFPLVPIFFMFFVSILAETNRVPFDLPEAESELVSGYHVEYSAAGFTIFFLAEYLNIILMSYLLVLLFFLDFFFLLYRPFFWY